MARCMTLEMLKMRCRECGDCWEWISAAKTEHARRYPQIQMNKKTLNVRRVIYATAKELRPSLSVVPHCGNPYCVNPDHCKAVTEQQKCKRAAERGSFSTTQRAKKIADARRKSFSKLNEDQAREIRCSLESGPVLAQRYGVHRSLVTRIKRGGAWKEYVGNPFAGLMG